LIDATKGKPENTAIQEKGDSSMSGHITIYMPLRNEGTPVWRPVQAKPRNDGNYEVLGPMPEIEEWMFLPGTIVRCRHQVLSGSESIVACEQVSN
jgi:hypothetical protein